MLEQTLQPLLAPVVMISACGLMILSLNTRVMTVKGRVRQFHLDRLNIRDAAKEAGLASDTQRLRFEGVGEHSVDLLRRLQLLRYALMCLVLCVVGMLTCSLLIGVSLLVPPVVYAAVASFIAGLLAMLIGALLFLAELRIALRDVIDEHDRVMSLDLPPEEGEAG